MNRTNDHIKQVQGWLDEHVKTYPTPMSVALTNFDFDWKNMSGSFCVEIDGSVIPDRFRLSLAQNGWVQFHPPMFTSPLGAPASYRAVDLTTETESAIENALKSVFPRLKPMGLDRETGTFIGQRTAVSDRVFDVVEFESTIHKVAQAGFRMVVPLGSTIAVNLN